MDSVTQRQAFVAASLALVSLRFAKIGGYGRRGIPLLERHDCRSLIRENCLVRVHASVELITELARLDDGAGMAMMEEVEAAVYPEAPWYQFTRGVSLNRRLEVARRITHG
jgi:hypothetical protein